MKHIYVTNLPMVTSPYLAHGHNNTLLPILLHHHSWIRLLWLPHCYNTLPPTLHSAAGAAAPLATCPPNTGVPEEMPRRLVFFPAVADASTLSLVPEPRGAARWATSLNQMEWRPCDGACLRTRIKLITVLHPFEVTYLIICHLISIIYYTIDQSPVVFDVCKGIKRLLVWYFST